MKKLKNEELGRLSVEGYKNAEKSPVVMVLDNIRSLNNVGSVFRTSDAFRVSEVMLCGITGKPPHREIQKTALGATESVDWKYFETTLEAVRYLKSQGYKVIAVEQMAESISLDRFIPKTKESYAFIFGNEINGISPDILQFVDHCIEIPQFGTKHSFNVSVSAGIILWHYYYRITHQ
jgi:tRNA G18 (ribose-2'-O)-methylase SpoU